jgi:hypothetical protein
MTFVKSFFEFMIKAILVTAMIMFLISACSDKEPKKSSQTSTFSPAFSISNEKHGCEHDCQWYYITGEITNTYNKPVRYLVVSFEYLNERNVIVGSSIDSFNNLNPGDTWRFKATNLVESVPGAKTYRIKEIKGIF